MELKIQLMESGVTIFLPEANVFFPLNSSGLLERIVDIFLIAFAFNHGQSRIQSRPWHVKRVLSGLTS